MRNLYLITAFVVVLVVSILGVRGTTFTKPPMDPFPDTFFPGMKSQPKFRAQDKSTFFADGRIDRMPVPHTVQTLDATPAEIAGNPDLQVEARRMVREDDRLYLGKNSDGSFVRGFPSQIKVDMALIARGQDRFTIFCQPCHGAVGDGNGVTKRYGMGATATYQDDRLRGMAEGEIYNTITNGKGNMLSYADKLTPEDRWAVIAYVRVLQRAQHSTIADVPADHKAELGLK